MDIDVIIEHISDSYSPLGESSKSDLRKSARIIHAPKKTILVKAGQYSDILYYVYKGAVRAFYLKDGREVSDWFAFDGFFMSAINSFFLGQPSEHYIEVLEDSKLLLLKRDDIERLCNFHHDFERLGRISVTKTMLALQQRVVSLQFKTAQERYNHLLSQFPFIEQRVPLGHIASFLGITQETLSRLRAN